VRIKYREAATNQVDLRPALNAKARLRHGAAERPLTSYKIGNVQYLLGTLRYDLGIFESHSRTLDYNFARVNDAIETVRQAQNSVRDSWQQLQQAVSANSTGTPVAQFSDRDISPLIRASDEKIQKASEAISQASQQRGQYNTQAKDLYKKMRLS